MANNSLVRLKNVEHDESHEQVNWQSFFENDFTYISVAEQNITRDENKKPQITPLDLKVF